MAIRFNKDLNREIRRVVDNYNRRRSRMIKAGMKDIPEIVKTSSLKTNYNNKKDLMKELKRLDSITSKSKNEYVNTSKDVKILKSDYQYIKNHLQMAKQYFTHEVNEARKYQEYGNTEKSDYLDNMEDKLEYLDRNLENLSYDEIKTFRVTIYEAVTAPERQARGYRGFLNEIEFAMNVVGFDDERQAKIFEKLNKLNFRQFHYLYHSNNLISRVYELADSPPLKDSRGNPKLNTDRDDAKVLLETFEERLDESIADALEH